jgi:hypothetical protein
MGPVQNWHYGQHTSARTSRIWKPRSTPGLTRSRKIISLGLTIAIMSIAKECPTLTGSVPVITCFWKLGKIKQRSSSSSVVTKFTWHMTNQTGTPSQNTMGCFKLHSAPGRCGNSKIKYLQCGPNYKSRASSRHKVQGKAQASQVEVYQETLDGHESWSLEGTSGIGRQTDGAYSLSRL